MLGPMVDDYIVFGKPLLGDAEIAAVSATIRSGWVGTGPRVKEFESRFSEISGCKHAIALSSCTAALHLSLEAWNIGAGHEVITTPLTFAATANAVVHSGATPIFVDVDRDTLNLDPTQVEASVTEHTRAILAVHMHGRPCNMKALRQIADRHDLLLIEDAAHAIEAEYHGQKVGGMGDAGCFSFYATKNITTVEGGMLCTNNDAVADKARILALQGMSADAWARFSDQGFKHYDVVHTGYKYNMTDIQAAIGLCQLERLVEWSERRAELWGRYDNALSDLPITLPLREEEHTVHARHLYAILVDEERTGISRNHFMAAMHRAKIGTGVHYRALHTQPYYRDRFGFKPEDFPNAAYIGDHTVSLPLSQGVSDADADRVLEQVRALVSH